MLRVYTGECAQALQSKLVYRGYDLEVRRAPSGWRVGIYPRSADDGAMLLSAAVETSGGG